MILKSHRFGGVGSFTIEAMLLLAFRCFVCSSDSVSTSFDTLRSLIGRLLVSHICNMVATYSVGPADSDTLSQIDWNIVYYSVTASTNVLTTFLIILRILSVGGLKSARTYRGLLEILIESAFLYTAIYSVYLALFIRDAYLPYYSITASYVYGLVNAATVSAPALVLIDSEFSSRHLHLL